MRFLLWLLSRAYCKPHRNSTSMCMHTRLPTHSKAPAHTHTCSHINKCPSATEGTSGTHHNCQQRGLSKTLVVTEPVYLLHGIVSVSLTMRAATQRGRGRPVAGEDVNTSESEWLRLRAEASCGMAAKGLVLQSLPYPGLASAWHWNVFSLKLLMEISASLAQRQVGHSLLALNL